MDGCLRGHPGSMRGDGVVLWLFVVGGPVLIAAAMLTDLTNLVRRGRGKPPLRSHLYPPQPIPPAVRPPEDPNDERLRHLRDAADTFEAGLPNRQTDEQQPDC